MRLIDADEIKRKSCHAKAFFNQPESLVVGLGYVIEAPTIEVNDNDFFEGQRSAEREILSRLYRAGASDKILQSARVNLSEGEFNRHIAALQRNTHKALDVQPPSI